MDVWISLRDVFPLASTTLVSTETDFERGDSFRFPSSRLTVPDPFEDLRRGDRGAVPGDITDRCTTIRTSRLNAAENVCSPPRGEPGIPVIIDTELPLRLAPVFTASGDVEGKSRVATFMFADAFSVDE